MSSDRLQQFEGPKKIKLNLKKNFYLEKKIRGAVIMLETLL